MFWMKTGLKVSHRVSEGAAGCWFFLSPTFEILVMSPIEYSLPWSRNLLIYSNWFIALTTPQTQVAVHTRCCTDLSCLSFHSWQVAGERSKPACLALSAPASGHGLAPLFSSSLKGRRGILLFANLWVSVFLRGSGSVGKNELENGMKVYLIFSVVFLMKPVVRSSI